QPLHAHPRQAPRCHGIRHPRRHQRSPHPRDRPRRVDDRLHAQLTVDLQHRLLPTLYKEARKGGSQESDLLGSFFPGFLIFPVVSPLSSYFFRALAPGTYRLPPPTNSCAPTSGRAPRGLRSISSATSRSGIAWSIASVARLVRRRFPSAGSTRLAVQFPVILL